MNEIENLGKEISEIKSEIISFKSRIDSKLIPSIKRIENGFKIMQPLLVRFDEELARSDGNDFYKTDLISNENISSLVEHYIEMEKAKFNNDYKSFCTNAYKQLERIWHIFYESYTKEKFLEDLTNVEIQKIPYSNDTKSRLLVDILFENPNSFPPYNREDLLKQLNSDQITYYHKRMFFEHKLSWNKITNTSVNPNLIIRLYLVSIIKFHRNKASHTNEPERKPSPPKKNDDYIIEFHKYESNPLYILENKHTYEVIKTYYDLLLGYLTKAKN